MLATIEEIKASPQLLQQQARELQQRLNRSLKTLARQQWPQFSARLEAVLPELLALYLELYGQQFDCYYQLEQLLKLLAKVAGERPAYLCAEDAKPQQWFQSETALGGACYVDLFAGDFKGLEQRIPYLKQTGINYLHLMPLFKAPEPNSDGGYAVSDYRSTQPSLGTMAELADLMAKLHQQGIRPVLDFVFNHTADEHRWAQRAKAGDPEYQNYYFFFSEAERDRYAPSLREIFPEIRRGCFTPEPNSGKHVWTTFNSFQWDLNYANPAVFNAMAAEMLFLANQGAAVLRLDALAFVWKEAGTCCENLPKAHSVIKAFNAVARIATPALQFKSEAIVHPDEVVKYIAPTECQLSYNPLLMALLWESLATRQTRLLTESLKRRFAIDRSCAWVNYIRCHDDIGWTFDDAIAWQLGVNPDHHRQFLNQFYTGQFAGSFASGVPFQQNPQTGDCRVAGMLASLAGVERALQDGNEQHLAHALARIYLLNSVILSIGGLPLLYLGDELGIGNDHSYLAEPAKKDDSRWVNRVAVTDQQLAAATQTDTLSGRIYQQLQQLVQCRAKLPVLGNGTTEILTPDNPHLFAYLRQSAAVTGAASRCLLLVNFSEHPQLTLLAQTQLAQTQQAQTQPASGWQDALSGVVLPGGPLTLQPYQVLWLIPQA